MCLKSTRAWFETKSRDQIVATVETGSIPVGCTKFIRNIGKSGLIRLVWDEETEGSNPSIPTKELTLTYGV